MASDKRKKASQKKKLKIIQTTMQLLLKKGNSVSASTTDICNAAKLTRPTLYHYFGSKRNLLLSVHLESIKTTLKPYLDEAASIDDPLKRLTYMVRIYTKDVMCKHPELRVLRRSGKNTIFLSVIQSLNSSQRAKLIPRSNHPGQHFSYWVC